MGTEPSTGLIVYTGTNSAGQQEGPGDSERPPGVLPVGLASRDEQVLVGVESTLETYCVKWRGA